MLLPVGLRHERKSFVRTPFETRSSCRKGRRLELMPPPYGGLSVLPTASQPSPLARAEIPALSTPAGFPFTAIVRMPSAGVSRISSRSSEEARSLRSDPRAGTARPVTRSPPAGKVRACSAESVAPPIPRDVPLIPPSDARGPGVHPGPPMQESRQRHLSNHLL
jgi:hypothetical protein